MKKIFIILAFLITGFGADAASRIGGPNARAGGVSGASKTPAPTTKTAARGRSAVQTPPNNSNSTTTSTRRTQVVTTAPGRSGQTPVVSRSAKQSVISTGTKVAAAAQNTVVDEKCWNGFMGCMDSFCMLDNASGGRCICSDKNAEYDSILAEIQSLDEQSYQMATVGVERIEMGDDANAVMKKTQEITKSIEKDSAQSKRKTLDLSAWDVNEIDFDAEVEDIFSLSSDGTGIANKTGDALYRAAAKLCNAQIPECKSQSTMMELMYKQRVRSDCTAYENSLRQQRTQSAQKLATAQSAMREAALEQYRNANKYDLGQCTVQFKQCMQTTGGCGDDFSGCVEYSVRQDLVNGGTDRNEKTIKGTSSKIKLSKATYDVLEAKKELCMSVTQQCVNVRDQVWDTFLREVAPQVKSAELMVESNMRSSCISNISTCFQKACKDNMDPNDPDGSYDMCLTNPDALEAACKVEIDPCKKSVPNIMTYVTARLASMRVDSCTREFKECLTSEDRCGADYTQCVGLDTDTIVEMCPVDKLPGCKYDSTGADNKDYVYKNLEKIATGIFLNIDNNMLSTCQKALDTAMLRVCGSTTECNDLIVDNDLGARSLEYKVCAFESDKGIDLNQCMVNIDMITDDDLGRNQIDAQGNDANVKIKQTKKNIAAIIDGLIYWDRVNIGDDGNIDTSDYFSNLEENDNNNGASEQNTGGSMSGLRAGSHSSRVANITSEQEKRVVSELNALQTSIQNAIKAIESDQTVAYCKDGREFQGYKRTLGAKGNDKARFPQLTDQVRKIITASALSQFKENYYAKYDELNEKRSKDYSTIAQRVAEIRGANNDDIRRDLARQSCVDLAEMSALARSAEPPKSAGTYLFGAMAMSSAAVGLTTGNPGMLVANSIMSALILSSNDANGDKFEPKSSSLTGSGGVNQWNYKETITTTFDWENLICHKCVRSSHCAKTRDPLVGDKYCDEWGEETETCSDTQF